MRRGEVANRQCAAGAALAPDAEPQMGELGETGRPWRLSGEWRGHMRQRRRLLRDPAQVGGFGALSIGKHAGAWRRISGALWHGGF
jgi:hypothetical protein